MSGNIGPCAFLRETQIGNLLCLRERTTRDHLGEKMLKKVRLLKLLVVSLVVAVSGADKYSRHDFPPGFVFGAGTSAYQVEGAADQDGRTPSIFDTFAHSGIMDGATGDVACDQYHKYKEDVQLMVETGLNGYRFSISWSRLIPNGRGSINPKGLQYYNNLIDELIRKGIQPHVTLHHVDLPQALEDEYGGWIDQKIVKDFTDYADVCFRMFGDRVKYWTTFNEANVFVLAGYNIGFLPPMHCSFPFGYYHNCSKGNSSTEPYLAAHNILLAHASAARLYKKTYQDKQKGFIGFNLFSYWFIPFTNKTEDVIATQRANDFYVGWFADPLVYGDYPDVMKKNVGSRLPSFTTHESKRIKGSIDFFGINFYSVLHIKDNPEILKMDPRDYNADTAVEMIFVQDNTSSPSVEFPVIPSGLRGVLDYFKRTYGNPPIFIHENGQRTLRNATLEDWPRVKSLHGYIGALLDSVRNGSDVRGYFTWSFLDLLELLDGYQAGFGLYYVDLDDPELRRYPKLSARWYSRFLKGGIVGSDGFIELERNFSSTYSSAEVFNF
ncbi:beta-glucosidase 11 isoform X2 [Eucalyptus grandis]|uniref:beta-glucosidase 11 isoform X2 n=1 Tax=Eucalyptus grandis TaxID=71139 RepID=UPI00192F0458|nr:beta-glucosidase 11 isoform X2 [Eucalyptus grandis]